jgi:hypothetical protein
MIGNELIATVYSVTIYFATPVSVNIIYTVNKILINIFIAK